MIFWVRKDACKYDSIGNEYSGHPKSKGLYRNWLCEVKSKEGSVWLSHSEYFDREHDNWECSIYGKSEFEIKEPENLNDYKQVSKQECSNVWHWG